MAARPASESSIAPHVARFGAAMALAFVCACQPTPTRNPDDALSFDDTPLTVRGTPTSTQTPPDALRRLDRLLDLFDAARFSGDPQLRDAFWAEMGENPARTEGAVASRNALSLLLEEAYTLEERGGLDETGERVLADLIQLLATDLHRPAEAEDQQVQTLVYRQLAIEGSPRVADNAAWRLYDFLRGTADAAVRAPADRRPFIVSHARLAVDGERDDVTAPPSAEQLATWLEQQRSRLAAFPRWADVVKARDVADAELAEQLAAVLPAQRFAEWTLYPLPAATTKQDSLAPVLYVSSKSSAIDPTEAEPRTGLSPRSDELASTLRQSLAQDGRGIMMLVCDPEEPASVFSSALELAASQAVDRIEFAVREDQTAPVRVLPLALARPGPSPGSQAFLEAKLRLHLDGGMVTVVREGKNPLASSPRSLPDSVEFLRGLATAFPDERAVALTVSRRVSVTQLLDLLVIAHAAGLGTLGLVVDGRSLPEAAGGLTERVELRTRLVSAKVALDQPYPLPKGDQQAVEAGIAQVTRCLGELGMRPRAGAVGLRLSFEEGVGEATFSMKRVPKEARESFEACATKALDRVRLREHPDHYTMRAGWTIEK